MTALERPEQRQASYISTFFRLPSQVFSSVELNDSMLRRVQDPRLKRWGEIGCLLKHAAVFALGIDFLWDSTIPAIKLPQTPTMHRGALVKIMQTSAPLVDEYGVCYTEIGVKGTGISAASHQYYAYSRYGDPLGLFGYEHSRQEQEISNNFASEKGRTDRVLAVMKIDPDNLLKWARSLPIPNTFYDLESMLKIVYRNRDEPALCVRLLGTERFKDYHEAANIGWRGIHTREKMIKRASALLAYEAEVRGEKAFRDRYKIPGFSFLPHLRQIATGIVSEEAMETLSFLQALLWQHNLDVKRRVSKLYYDNGLTMRTDPQNYDLAGFVYDWETSKPGTKQYYLEGAINENPMIPPPLISLEQFNNFMKFAVSHHASLRS